MAAYNPSQPEISTNGDYQGTYTYPYPSNNNYQYNNDNNNNYPTDNSSHQGSAHDFIMMNEALSFANSRIETLVNLLNQKELEKSNLIKAVESLTNTNQILSESNKKLSDQNDLFTSMLSQILKSVQGVSNSSETLRFNKKPSSDNDNTSHDISHAKKPPSPPAFKRPPTTSSDITPSHQNKKSTTPTTHTTHTTPTTPKKTTPSGNEKSNPLKRNISTTITPPPKLRKVV